MNLIPRTALALILASTVASAQVLIPLAQTRSVSGDAAADDFVTFLTDSEFHQAPDFTQFMATASATLNHPDVGGTGGSSQTSDIFADSFVGIGSAFADTFVNESPWLAQTSGFSIATLEFQVTEKVQYHLVGTVTAFDNGVTVADLRILGGGFIGGNASIGEGDVDIDETGILTPGSYSISFRASGSAESNGGGFDFAFGEFDMGFYLTPLASNACVAAANSAGPGALLSLGGSTSIAANDFRVEASGTPPNVFGLAFYGPNLIQAPFGDGFRCAGGQTHRVQPPIQADGSGFVSKPISFLTGPASSGNGQIFSESTWYFQFWYRDPMGPGGSGFNTSDALRVVFCP